MTAEHPLVSVVVPTYGQAQYLPITLDAIWFQDYPNLEIVVVNAASPDNTEKVLETFQTAVECDQVSYASHYRESSGEVERTSHPRYLGSGRRLKVISLKADPGLSETYNAGIRESKGKYLAPVVSDDIPHPAMISNLARALQDGADFAYADQFIVDDAGRILRRFEFPEYEFKTCLADWYLLGNSRMWRRDLHESCGYFDPKYIAAHDYDLILRFALGGARFVHVPKVLYSVRYHGEGRKTGNHTEERERLIHEESKEIAMRARDNGDYFKPTLMPPPELEPTEMLSKSWRTLRG